jgi:predicted O-linked N-acetylglucosamine transferase (SPINDLY family)
LRIATVLAGDLDRLAALRASMRGRMLASPLLDGAGFARAIEAAYRRMWEIWCADEPPRPFSLGCAGAGCVGRSAP